MKRKRKEKIPKDAATPLTMTQLKTVNCAAEGSVSPDAASAIETPTKCRRGRPRGSTKKDNALTKDLAKFSKHGPSVSPLPGKKLFSTPRKPAPEASLESTNPIVHNADRSARRKSARVLIERTIEGGLSEEDELAEGSTIAERIWEDDDAEDEAPMQALDEGAETIDAVPDTPSKRRPVRTKPARRKRSPTPPQHLPPHEQYFFDNRPGGVKTSNNTLDSVTLLTHEEYFDGIRAYVDPHVLERDFLEELHARSFHQWHFETSEGFNICLYGWGSKRKLLMDYVHWLYTKGRKSTGDPPKIVIINGYTATLSIREVLTTIANSLLGPEHQQKLGNQPSEILEMIFSFLSKQDMAHALTIVIHSIDASPLRRQSTQALLARLASHSFIHLLATADTPSFAFLWDSSLREQFNFVFHDSTTFAPYETEISVVDDVHELLGRSGRRVGGKEGVGFVLKSLPEKARDLYRVLVSEQLAGMEEALAVSDEAEEQGGIYGGVEYRALYQKSAEEFICSNEMNFRTLLKEFHDHQMLSSRKDALGTELLCVPFQKHELESILEDLIS